VTSGMCGFETELKWPLRLVNDVELWCLICWLRRLP